MKRTNLIIARVFTLGLLATLLIPHVAAQAANKKPNIVFILADNIGWGDFSVYGGTTATPRIDALAKSGIRFNNYNVEGQCAPSRSAVMSGRQSVRSGTFTVPLDPHLPYGLAPWEYMIAKHTTDYIARQAKTGKPFFVYTALSHMHPPEKNHPDFDQRSSERIGAYSDMIAEMDFRVGQILDAIKQAGADDNTIVVFSSDNGGGGISSIMGGSSGPWRGRSIRY